MHSLKVLILAGMAGAGKTEFAEYCRSRGVRVIQMGDLVRKRVNELGMELNSRNTARIANEERLKFGNEIWAVRTAKMVMGENVVVDGTRSESEVSHFRNMFGKNAIVVAIFASSDTRYERLRKRNREDVPITRGEFEERDRRELGWGLGNVIALADRFISNEGSIEEFREKIGQLLSEVEFRKEASI